jgi:dTDP-4-dehydrorhamnose reductase
MLGKAVGRRLSSNGTAFVGTDLDVDIADLDAVLAFAARQRPRVIVNCAAYTAVDAAEKDEPAALRVNGDGPRCLALAARDVGATLVHVSTDYVFEGEGTRPYTESDPVHPKNAYGRTKLAGERAIEEVLGTVQNRPDTGWLIFRTSWLFGDGPSSFVETMWRLMLEKDELRVVSDQMGRPTYVEDLAQTILWSAGIEAAETLPNGIWHFANREPTSWHGFATAIRESMVRVGAKVRTQSIIPVASEEFPRPASRPHFSVLDTSKLEARGRMPRTWSEALEEYIVSRWARTSTA